MITLTNHFFTRATERTELTNRKKISRNAELAISRGKTARDYTGRKKEYLQKKATDGCHAVSYNGNCYIFTDSGKGITLFPLPDWFSQSVHYIGKERIRNFKKYCRENNYYPEQQ